VPSPTASSALPDGALPRVRQVEVGGNAIDVVDSAGGRWLLDTERQRFARLPDGRPIDASILALPWAPWSTLEWDPRDGAFVLVLDRGGRRRLRVGGVAAPQRANGNGSP
jgi:hypothetical protein